MKKVKLSIEGMHCASCGTNVTRSLSKLGAQDVNVNVLLGKANAVIEEDVTEKELKKAVRKAGFEVRSIEYE